jgi:hypothetical protein
MMRAWPIGPEGEARCRQLLADRMAALDRHDAAVMEACPRFPHVRLAANNLAACDAQASQPGLSIRPGGHGASHR